MSYKYRNEELASMKVNDRIGLFKQCHQNKDLDGLLDLTVYSFKHGAVATMYHDLPAMCYFFARKRKLDELNSILTEYSWVTIELSKDCLDRSLKLVDIGLHFPFLSESDMLFLESLYNNPKTFELADDILFDKDLLPRPLKGLKKADFNKVNSNWSDDFLLEVYSCFEKNSELDDSYQSLYIYERRTNTIIRKKYEDCGVGDYIIDGNMRSKSVIAYISSNYGQECADYVLDNFSRGDVEQRKYMLMDLMAFNAIDVYEVISSYFRDNNTNNEIKKGLANLFLKRCNAKQIFKD